MPEKPAGMPKAIAAILGDAFGKTDGLGKSEANVYLYDDYVLKVRPAGGWDTVDTRILRWLSSTWWTAATPSRSPSPSTTPTAPPNSAG